MSVSYLLIVEVGDVLEVTVAGKGYVLERGYYAYVGSARLARPYLRVLRHFNPTKKLRWHIDYVTSHESARPVVAIILYGVSEDSLYNFLVDDEMFEPVAPGFGATDRRTHISHLFKVASPTAPDVFRELSSLTESLEPLLVEVLYWL